MAFQWHTTRPQVMGILNVTPDSFSDGGKFSTVDAAVAQAQRMIEAGADILDIGGESTRPGSVSVSVEEELRRVVPVVEAIVATLREKRPLISIDTTKAVVAEKALAAGAQIINDISALRFDPRMTEVVVKAGAGVVLMHMQGDPATMQKNPHYGDVVAEVREFLKERIAFAVAQGLKKSQIAVDPGIGFGKTVEHNLRLLAGLEQLVGLSCPILVGASRKSFISQVAGVGPADRLAGSLAVAAWAVANGAAIIRAHDVAETVSLVRMIHLINSQS